LSSPFNELKYKELLEGLEISEVMLSEAISITGDRRLDSEYYLKKYVHLDNVLKQKETIPFKDYCNFIKKGIFDLSPENYQTSGIPFIRTSEIKNPQIDFSTTVFIDTKTHRENCKTSLKSRDLVFTKIGAYIGDVAMLPSNYSDYNFSQNVAGASLKNKINGPYLLAFFLSELGKSQILRSLMLSGQGKLELDDIRNYKIPTVSDVFKQQMSEIFNQIELTQTQSKKLYSEAEKILLSELGLKNWQPNNNLVNIKQLKESFLASGRLDAEYYQPKYDALFAQLSKYECDTIKDIAHINKSVEPGSEAYQDSGIPFVRVSDVSKFGISEPSIYLSPYDFNLNELRPKKDTILLSKDGSVGIAYKVEEDMDCITSGALLHLSVFNEDYTPDYLTLVLNSIVVQMQAERDSNGAIIQHWKPSEIEQVIIPKLPKPIQETISAKIQESFALKAESNQLLDEAKMMVEREIEKGGE
jgi:type I restriction enzyme M protein